MGSEYFKKRCLAHFAKAKKPKDKPKAFKSESHAHKWAKDKKITKYTVEPVGKSGKKFKIKLAMFL